MVFLTLLDLIQYPRPAVGKEFLCCFTDDIAGADFHNFQAGFVTGNNVSLIVDCDNGIGHAGEHALVIGTLFGHILKKFCVFESNRHLLGESLKPGFIFVGKAAALFIQRLCATNALPILVDDGDAQNRAGEIAGLLVKTRIKAKIGISVGNIHCLLGRKHGASDAGCIW